ncbi:dTDP-4-dehydrorhamnose 3,5-epimerase family protein [Streptantibioticus silvisoli]|uniref:dTDP-4-dehydrorhamnose 3,5-epimerase family protein n=1 Tax=Streptantibioticus silvisoli TaxID=2705255 RepID=A0ABT6W517_9ACTN|nr:dTDP-4-dehydrorhamnose 3,5-epimerase family protein [Streptantibioticus silvisoli]MDI5965840.1 dTDP-4-dehydrorhamnose 3,5-epimerase family protein [Streptantibioticus silvisoli]
MRFAELEVPGSFVITPDQIGDDRGTFYESMRTDEFERVMGQPFEPRQINYSVSRRNTLRGLHSVADPPAQAKYITCVRGVLRDFVVDLRVGSPTFGRWASTLLDADSGVSVYVPEGVGHGFLTLTDDACICYVLSSAFVPGTQIDINPLDPDLALPWGFTEQPLMSAKDEKAPSLKEVMDAGLLMPWRG